MAKTAEKIIGRPHLLESELYHSAQQPIPQYESKRILVFFAQILMDLMGFFVSLLVAIVIRSKLLPMVNPDFQSYIPAAFYNSLWWITVILITCLAYGGIYTQRRSFWREAQKIVTVILMAFLITMATIFLAKLGDEFLRITLVITYMFTLFMLPLSRYISKNFLFRLGIWTEPVLIMGAGETGKLIAQSLMDDCYLGYQVYGFLEDDPVKKAKGVIINNCSYKILGGFNDATAVIQDNNIRNVIIATPGLPGPELVKLTNRLKGYTHSIHVVPDLIGIPVNEVQIDYYCNDQIIGYSTCNNLAKPLNLFAKRIFDLVIGMIAFVAVIPLMAVIFLAVIIDSQGPAIYSGKRIGQNGKEFKCYKFRTMFVDNEQILDRYLTENPLIKEQWIKYAKLRGYDPRVTKIGNLLRKSSLDELPQILNVLKGDMSLVGAR
ncbi:MAG: sugar transferase, partial [Syntrophomonas sp.]